jgi:DNA repair photolyase
MENTQEISNTLNSVSDMSAPISETTSLEDQILKEELKKHFLEIKTCKINAQRHLDIFSYHANK